MSPRLPNSTSSLRFPILLEDVKQLLEEIRKLCGKISVAKVDLSPSLSPSILTKRSVHPKQKETSQLAELCDVLSDHLGDSSLRSPNHDDVKRPVYHHHLSTYPR